MKVYSTQCNVCGKTKGEANKWIVIKIRTDPKTPYITIARDLIPTHGVELEDICSDTCMQKRLGQVLKLIREEPQASPDESSKPPMNVDELGHLVRKTFAEFGMDSFDDPAGVPILQVTPNMPRAPLSADHQTEHYRITEWVPPTADSPYHKFFTAGPGADGKCYIALGASCGPHLIHSLEAAYCAGFREAVDTDGRGWHQNLGWMGQGVKK